MGKYIREEDDADLWLREHDPYYLDKGKNKREKYGVYYETPDQEERRRNMEIPISSLNAKQRLQLKEAGAGAYNEKGEFKSSPFL